MKPLCIDLFCGLGGWTEGFLAEGYRVIGFDNHRHEYGEQRYSGQLVIQDVLTIHGSQFKDAAVIVASPPCQNYSYLAMPNPDGSRTLPDGTKIGSGWFSDPNSTCHKHGSRSQARKAASAQIAKIPLPLSEHLARVFWPRELRS